MQTSKKPTQVDRVLILLEMLSSNETLCLSKEEDLLEKMNDYNASFQSIDVGLRSLQKDMLYVKAYLKDNLSKEGNCYQLLKKDSLDDFFQDNHKEIRNFFHAISLIDASVFGKKFEKYKPLLKSIQSEQKGVYLFLENPFENLKQLNLKKRLEEYIQERNYINIEYNSDKCHKYKRVQPYKIIYLNGSWYLAVITTQDYEINSGFKLLRLNFLEKITLCRFSPQHFHEDIQVKDFLENKFQSLFTSFDKKFFKVRLKVGNKAARFFKVKKYLKSQRIVKETEDYIIVELMTNDDMEIIPLVQRWLPHVKVLEPQSLNEKILNNLKLYQEK